MQWEKAPPPGLSPARGAPGRNHAGVPDPGELSGRPAGGLQRGNCSVPSAAPTAQLPSPSASRLISGAGPSQPSSSPGPQNNSQQSPKSALVMGGCLSDGRTAKRGRLLPATLGIDFPWQLT